MRLTVPMLICSTLLAFAPVAYAGGLDNTEDEQPVLIPIEEGSNSSAPGALSLGSLGGGGAVAGVLAVALVAAALASSGSH